MRYMIDGHQQTYMLIIVLLSSWYFLFWGSSKFYPNEQVGIVCNWLNMIADMVLVSCYKMFIILVIDRIADLLIWGGITITRIETSQPALRGQ